MLELWRNVRAIEKLRSKCELTFTHTIYITIWYCKPLCLCFLKNSMKHETDCFIIHTLQAYKLQLIGKLVKYVKENCCRNLYWTDKQEGKFLLNLMKPAKNSWKMHCHVVLNYAGSVKAMLAHREVFLEPVAKLVLKRQESKLIKNN